MSGAILCQWDGEAMRPYGSYWEKVADREWVVGERYPVECREDRSSASHRAYFAAVNECWQNLPEHLAEQFPTAEMLRKKALIRAGFRDERSFVTRSNAEALRLAAFLRPMDEFAIVSVSGTTVVVLTAKSQSMRSMGKADFQRSKDAVLSILADMIGTTPRTLSEEAAE